MDESPETTGVTTDDIDQLLPELSLVVHDVEANDKSVPQAIREIRQLLLKLVWSKRIAEGLRQ